MSASLPPLGRTIFSNLTLFENSGRFVLCGTDDQGERYRVLCIEFDGSSHPTLIENPDTFDSRSLRRWLAERSGSEHFRVRLRSLAFLGFVCLLENDWHMHFVTERSTVGVIGGNNIYRVGSAVLVAMKSEPESALPPLVQKYRSLFNAVDMTKDFYYSDTFDLTRTMQDNVVKPNTSFESLTCWNTASIQTALRMKCSSYWLTSIICGFFEQQIVDLPSQMSSVVITLLCRRSRMMAGTRYQRRGLSTSNRGEVANEVQTEILVALGNLWKSDTPYAGMTMHRGSIPLFWGHDQEKVSQPKPDIIFGRNDRDFATTELHFKRLIDVYSSPIVSLSLIRQGTHKECSIGSKYDLAIHTLSLNSRFGEDDVVYLKYDFLSEQKAGKNISEEIKRLTEDYALKMGFLLNDRAVYSSDRPKRVQRGVFRVNCIDCLDRTNFAQYCIVQRCFVLFLEALGLEADDDWENSYPKISQCLKDLFMHHGDRIANQYAGSGAMHKHAFSTTQAEDLQDQEEQELDADNRLTMDQVKGKVISTFGKLKTNAANNNALTAIRRYYSNAVTDRAKNQAIQVFLGHFKPTTGRSHIWDLPPETIHQEELSWSAADEIPLLYPWGELRAVQSNKSDFNPAVSTHELIDLSFINNNSGPVEL